MDNCKNAGGPLHLFLVTTFNLWGGKKNMFKNGGGCDQGLKKNFFAFQDDSDQKTVGKLSSNREAPPPFGKIPNFFFNPFLIFYLA